MNKKEVKNTMPYSLEAEQSLLGCIFFDNEIIADVLGLSEDDFYLEPHQLIFAAIKRVFAAHKPIDIVTVSDSLESAAALAKVGGISYLTEVIQVMPSAANYKFYYEIVRRDSTCRRLARSAREILDYACSGGHTEIDAIRFAEDKIYSVSKRNDSSIMKNVSEILPNILEEYQCRQEDKSATRGVMTGINRLDRLTNGLQKSNLIVLAARPGIGKTSLAMNIVEHAALSGSVCAVFSLEMSELEITKRLIASISEVSQSKSNSGDMTVDEWRRIIAATARLENSVIEIDDSSLVTPAEIFSKCRRIKAKHGGRLDLVMIDYIQLMHSSDKGDAENRNTEVASITRDLKIMAKELDVPVLALSQLRRRSATEKQTEPQLSDLRESGAIEQDADMVMFINRPDMNATDEDVQKEGIVRGMAYLTVSKNRHGGLDKIPLRFKGDITKFVNPEFNDETASRAEHLKH